MFANQRLFFRAFGFFKVFELNDFTYLIFIKILAIIQHKQQ
jgi:hypothetical protein